MAQTERKTTQKKQRHWGRKFLLLLILTGVILVGVQNKDKTEASDHGLQNQIEQDDRVKSEEIPKEENLSTAEKLKVIQTSGNYPEAMISFANHYQEAVDYVYEYPELKNTQSEIDLSAETTAEWVPLLMQWDARWGYLPYGDGLLGYTGCGPVALSMVALYLTKDPQWTPVRIADMAVEQGYCVPGNGSSWDLIREGSRQLGLQARAIPLKQEAIQAELDQDHPIIVVVGPGTFTRSGHFLVIIGYDETGFFINDPNSYENSCQTWSYESLQSEIKDLWAISKP